MTMIRFSQLNQHIIMKFMPLSHLKGLLTLITIMVSLKLTMRIGTGSITMTQLARSVIFKLSSILMEQLCWDGLF